METINNVATAASKAVFGSTDANKEPVSGAQGDVTKGEPYDAGNLEPTEQDKVEKRLSDDKVDQIKDSSKVKDEGAKDDTNKTDDAAEEQEVKLDGPGPKPLAEVAKEHGGDAGNKEVAKPADAADDSADNKDGAENKDSQGTGTEHVKTTGFAAEGGDFDATKPGAGAEADRLQAEKEGGSATQAPTGTAGKSGIDKTAGDSKDSTKPSLSQRIKAKFRKH